jgi:hypothetical protein
VGYHKHEEGPEGVGGTEDSDDGGGVDVGGDLWDQMSDVGEENVVQSGNHGDGDHTAAMSSSQTEMLEEFKKLTSVTDSQLALSKPTCVVAVEELCVCSIR